MGESKAKMVYTIYFYLSQKANKIKKKKKTQTNIEREYS